MRVPRDSQVNGVESIHTPGLNVQHREAGDRLSREVVTAQALPLCVNRFGGGLA